MLEEDLLVCLNVFIRYEKVPWMSVELYELPEEVDKLGIPETTDSPIIYLHMVNHTLLGQHGIIVNKVVTVLYFFYRKKNRQ